jgi:hypothetical protein
MHFENRAMTGRRFLGKNMASRAGADLRLHIEQRRASGRAKNKVAH